METAWWNTTRLLPKQSRTRRKEDSKQRVEEMGEIANVTKNEHKQTIINTSQTLTANSATTK
jgi:hypothetical protein